MGALNSMVKADAELTSGILPMICDLLAREADCNVVDLSAASTGNCNFFSRNGARVFIDTSGDSLRARIAVCNDLDTTDLDNLLEHCPTPIDVLLFWDLLDYLPLETIKVAARRFSEVMRPGGLFYAMNSRQRYIPDRPAVIDMVREDRLRFLYDDGAQREGPEYASKQLEHCMPGFVLEKLYLLQNGVQEQLFLFEGLD